tara:strand:+ start:7402 stop:8874 length:1473 start_codon:yes stop_codon:yes gene_type:complete
LLHIQKLNNTYLKIRTDAGISQELRDYFTFRVPGFQFMKKYKQGVWDGNIRLYNVITGTLYTGLLAEVIKFAEARNYQIELDDHLDIASEFSVYEAKSFFDSLGLPHKVRPYQGKAFLDAVRYGRVLFVSPTASGKSLIIYLIIRKLLNDLPDSKILLLVPTTHLVRQMYTDFEDYGWNYCNECVQMIYSGLSKEITKDVVISTWQSAVNMPRSFYDQFDMIIGDEAHLWTAKSFLKIMENAVAIPYRFGFTGTLDDSLTHELVLQGLFGPTKNVTTTSKLIDDGYLADIHIKILTLLYPVADRLLVKGAKYKDEISYLVGHRFRNKFIKNLTLSLTGNTLLLYNYVDKHGKPLYDLISKHSGSKRKVFLIHGKTDVEQREEIRKIIESETDAIVIASYGTFSTGVNIRNLHNIIFGSPYKSKIRVLQSIGRGLRRGDSKDYCTLYDIADDLSVGRRINFAMKHVVKRMAMYGKEDFKFKIYRIKIGKGP